MTHQFFATASLGTASALAAELRELGLPAIDEQKGGVAFGEVLEDGYRACLWSRIASRVLKPLATFEVDSAEALYEGIFEIPWADHLAADRTLAIDVAGGNSPAGPPNFVVLKSKDAIVDRIRQSEGARPNIDTERPDLRVNVHLKGSQVTVSLDFAGRSLHRRGIGRAGTGLAGTAAPLKENLAAAILRLAGWSERGQEVPLYDPMCGSGTLLTEAAWMALDVAPGLARQGFGAAGWSGHDAKLWQELYNEARDRRAAGEEREIRLAGADASKEALSAVRRNLHKAGLGGRVRLVRAELQDAKPPWDTKPEEGGLVVTNPPYGVRLGGAAELGPLYELLGDVLKQRFPGWTAYVLCGEPKLVKRIGLRPTARHVLYNGPIECRLLEIPISPEKVESSEGPGWRKASPQATGFANKLRKNLRVLRRWAKRNDVTCYRVYDTDMPVYNLAVDWYDGALRVEEYAPPKRVREAQADHRLHDALQAVAEVFEVEPKEIVLRQRRRLKGGQQHERRGEAGVLRPVREGELSFLVNLTDYLDTGLFLDDRLLRKRIRERAEGIDFLNLFAYTCTASVAAAAGGAKTTTSIDLSSTYLDWGGRNFALNGFEDGPWPAHRRIRDDVLAALKEPSDRQYDLIFVAPPTWSRSKAMQGDFDIQRDHGWLLERCSERLTPGGEILFTTNLREFEFDGPAGVEAREITEEITPRDFARRPRLRAWALRRSAVASS